MAKALYLDSSAIVKMILREPESPQVLRMVRRFRIRVSSSIARTEVIRAVRRWDLNALGVAHDALETLHLLDIGDTVLEDAGALEPMELRTLDAIHLTTARSLGSDLAAFVTYDARQAKAAVQLGMPVESPSK